MDKKEKSLQEALRYTSMQAIGLPKRYTSTDKRIWIRAIVLVRKRTMAECYCVYQRRGDGYMSLIRDCGEDAGCILDILSIHPYIYLDEERFFPNTGYIRKRYLLKMELTECDKSRDVSYVDDLTNEQVDIALIDEGIRIQLANREIDMANNASSEGVDVYGTSIIEEINRKFEAEVKRMREAGCTMVEINKFTEEHEKEINTLKDGNSFQEDDEFKSLEEEIRAEFEENSKENDSISVIGEFDEKELDIDAIRTASEQYRLEQKRMAVRKFNRKADGRDKVLGGRNFLNEIGETEEVETLELPEDAAEKQIEILEKEERKRERTYKNSQETSPSVKRRGRPRGSKNKSKKI